MEVNPSEIERPMIVLRQHGSGFPMPKIQRVAFAALTLETFDAAAINGLIGIGEKEVQDVLRILVANGWDTMAALETAQLNERVDMTSNDNCYPILECMGVKE